MPGSVKNVLYIMFDQLRFDYLSCYGHPTLHTPNIDALAKRGVRFDRAYAQSTICGSSRMCSYTGRYMSSHGGSWNLYPLKVGEMTLGDYMRPQGLQTVLVGKTHMQADEEGMERLGIPFDSQIGKRLAECGFDVHERDDGLAAEGPAGNYGEIDTQYNDWLREQGYSGRNPWHDWANSGEDENGDLVSGWFMHHASKPARIKEEDSETPYMTRRAIEFIEQAGGQQWCMHLSYIKPHWPYIVPAPYHNMYSVTDIIPVVQSESERDNPHPLYQAFMNNRVGKAFSREEVRHTVIPAYMGLIKQIDDQMGVLFDYLESKNLFDSTMIVITSDHGDYLGDHWLGEKDMFHEPSVKVPMIIFDPSSEADSTRGTVCGDLVEAIDLVPTFLEAAGGEAQPHRLEGRSLLPLLRGTKTENWREFVISEYDYSALPFCPKMGIEPLNARMFMIANKRWKYIEAPGFSPMLYDLENDPQEFVDLGENPEYSVERTCMSEGLKQWALRNSQRTAISNRQIESKRGSSASKGIIVGAWEESDVAPELWSKYRGENQSGTH